MTKQELIEMTGNEEQAEYAIKILLKNCKESFIKMAIQAELKEINNKIEDFKKEGIIYTANNCNVVNWGLENKVYGDKPGAYWHATKEQKQEAERIVKRCEEADALLYRRNRTISLIAVRV